MVTALIKFEQGATVGVAGESLIGVVAGDPVVASNDDDTNVGWATFTFVDVPPTSAIPLGVAQDSATLTYEFEPDVVGGYFLAMTVRESQFSAVSASDRRVFQVLEASGRLIPPFLAEASHLNFGGQARGWAKYFEEWLHAVDAGGGGANLDTDNGTVTQAADEIDTEDDTPTPIGDVFPLANNAGTVIDVQISCIDDVADGMRVFNTRRLFLNKEGVITAGTQFDPIDPQDVGTAPDGSIAIEYTGTDAQAEVTGLPATSLRWHVIRQSVELISAAGGAPALNIISISPSTGATETATAVTATGTGFVSGCTWTVGGIAATGVSFISSTEVDFTTPATLVAGSYDVVVTNPDASTDTLVGGWTSSDAAAPTVSAISQDLGPIEGGGSHTITGTDFTGATGVTIGAVACTSVVVVNPTTITCVGPAHAAASGQSVLVTTPAGTNAANALFEFWSPSILVAEGYWDKELGPYVLGSFPGVASAGGSSGRNLVQAGGIFQPAVSSGEPDFDGTDDYLTNATAISSYITASAGTVLAVFDADVADAPVDSYLDPQIFGDQATYMGMYYNSNGVGAYLLDAGRTPVQKAAAAGVRHCAMMRWDGVNLGVTVGAAAEVTAACGPITTVTGTVVVGQAYDSSSQLNGRIRVILAMQSKISDANYTKFLKWSRAARGAT